MRNTLIALLAMTAISAADDWPQWLGPNRDGTIPGKLAPWTGELKRVWRAEVGEGNSSPVVSGNLVFIHEKTKDKDVEVVRAFDVRTGAAVWDQSYDKTPFKPLFGQGPRATPCIHDGMIYTLGNTGVLACWEAATGKTIWKTETLSDPKKHNLLFGISASPLVVGPNVIVQGGGSGSKGIKAYDRKTGNLAWNAGNDAASYAAPVQIDRQIVALTGAHLTAISETGETLWKFPFKDALNESSTTPIKVGELFIASSVTAGAVAVKVNEKDGKLVAEQAWRNPKLTCYFSTPVEVASDHLYMITGVASLTNASVTLHCVEIKTGNVTWSLPNVGKYHAALLKGSCGNVLMHSDNGELRHLAPNTTKYEERAKSKISGETWAHPAVAGGRIYVRDGSHLICLSLSN